MFVIRSLPRTGTHLVRSTLSRHPKLRCRAEIFHQAVYSDTIAKGPLFVLRKWIEDPGDGFVIHDLGRLARSGVDCYAELFDLIQLWTPPVINLWRRDTLRVCASHRTAAATQQWNQDIGTGERKNPSVRMRWTDIQPCIADHERFAARTDKFNWGVTVCYEDLVADFDSEMARVQQYLGVEPLKLSPKTRKLDTRPIREIISNYDQVCDMLHQHGRSEMIQIAEEYDEQRIVPARPD